MKKLGSIILAILLIAAGGWFYLANEFEKMVTKEIIPKIKNNNSVITADLDSLLIEKFKFKLTLNNVIILSQIPDLKITSDKMIATYNPFADKLTAKFNGDKITFGAGETEIYIPSPDQTIEFNRELLNKSYDNIDIKITSKEPSIYFANNDQFIMKANDLNVNFSSKLDENDMYNINFTDNLDKIITNPESQYLLSIIDKSLPNKEEYTFSEFEEILLEYVRNTASSTFYSDLISATGAMDHNAEYSVRLSKKNIDGLERQIELNTISSEKVTTTLSQRFEAMFDKFSIIGQESLKNEALSASSNLSIINDEGVVKLDLNIGYNANYTDEQKKILAKKLAKEISISSNKELTKLNIVTKFEPQDFEKLASHLNEIKKFKLSLLGDYDIKSSDINHSFKISLDDFSTEITGAKEQGAYSGKTIISTPKKLIAWLTDFYSNIASPFILKVTNDTNTKAHTDRIQIMKNISDNGFDAISALHEKEDLKDDDDLVMSIILNPARFDFQLNGKNILELMTDEKIAKFLKNMPDNNNSPQAE